MHSTPLTLLQSSMRIQSDRHKIKRHATRSCRVMQVILCLSASRRPRTMDYPSLQHRAGTSRALPRH